MTDSLVPVATAVPAQRANELLALLGALDIEAEYLAGAILVRPIDEAAARRILAETDVTEPLPELREPAVLWSSRGLGALFLVAIACVAVFWSTHLRGAAPTRARLVEHGAISWSLVERGETWRLLTGIFVHFDGAHLLANLLTLALVGPPLAHLLGPARFLVVFVASGFLGNLASHLLNPSLGLKAGASGAIAGVLGALAGQALRRDRPTRFRRWQTLGALCAIYALLVGAGPGRDNIAHAAGLLAGLVLGWLLPRARWQARHAALPGGADRHGNDR